VICEALQILIPEMTGAALFLAETQKEQGRQLALWGKPELLYKVHEREYRVSAGAFFQVNHSLTESLVSRVSQGRAGRTAWDLYAGVGLFSRALAETFERVIAVEQAAVSVRDLRHNLPQTQHRVVASGTLEFLKHQLNLAAPDFVVVDPPRAGLGKEVTALLSRIGPSELIYVSCDPTTLARDVQLLLHSGYRLRKTTLVDFFPQTYHLETIVELTR
jgi:23S rRNA (uracil1939-C5)-methyltransferase